MTKQRKHTRKSKLGNRFIAGGKKIDTKMLISLIIDYGADRKASGLLQTSDFKRSEVFDKSSIKTFMEIRKILGR